MRRGVLPTVLLTVLAGPLTACGDQAEDYCDSVEAHQLELGRTSAEGGPGAVLALVPTLEKIAAEAPSDIKDEWQTLLGALGALQQAFDDAGVDPATYDPETTTLSEEQQARIGQSAADLGSEAVRVASMGIEQHALDVCQTPIGL